MRRLLATIGALRAELARVRSERDEAAGLLDFELGCADEAHEPTVFLTSCRSCAKRWPCPTARARELLERLSQQVAASTEQRRSRTALDGAGTAPHGVPDAALSPGVRTRILAGDRRYEAGVPTMCDVGLAAVVGALAAHPDWISFLLTPTMCDEGATHTNYLGELYEGRADEVLLAAKVRAALDSGGGGREGSAARLRRPPRLPGHMRECSRLQAGGESPSKNRSPLASDVAFRTASSDAPPLVPT